MFNWETEESIDWDDLSQEPEPSPEKPNRRWLWFAFVGVLLISAAAAIVWRTVNNTLEEAEFRVENDVLASASIVHQTAQTRDSDLFTTFLSGKDEPWAFAQERALQKGEYFERDALGMVWQPVDPINNSTVELSSDLLSAQVTLTQTYSIDIGNSLTETVVLTQTAVYRLGPNRWLLAPPEEAFWGEQKSYTGTLLTTNYYERDEAVALPLARDLDAFLLTLCEQIYTNECLFEGTVELAMTAKSPSFSELLLMGRMDEGQYVFGALPSPSVAGWPTNEVSYHALYRGYAAVLGVNFLDQIMAEGCCADNPFYHALRAELLWQTGIRPFTPPTSEFAPQTVEELIPLEQLGLVWRDNDTLALDEWEQVNPVAYQFMDIVLNGSEVPPSALFNTMITHQAASFDDWAVHIAGRMRISDAELRRRWLAKQYDQTAVSQGPPPIPLPNQNIAMVCQNRVGGYELYKLFLEDERRDLVSGLGVTLPSLLALPTEDAFAVGFSNSGYTTSSLRVVQGSTESTLSWDRVFNQPDATPLRLDPTGELLLLGGISGTGGILELETCRTESACSFRAVNGIPHWSPDGSRTVLQTGSEIYVEGEGGFGRLVLSDRFGEPPPLEEALTRAILLGNGRFPTWVSNEEIVWLIDGGAPGAERVMRSSVDEIAPEHLLTQADVRDIVQESGNRLRFEALHAHPTEQNHFLIVVTTSDSFSTQTNLIDFDVEAEEGELLVSFDSRFFSNMKLESVSPDGRFFIFTSDNPAIDGRREVVLLDTETNTSQIFPLQSETFTLDWSENGRWLLLTEGGLLRLIAPELDYQQLKIYDGTDCTAAVWLYK